MNKADAWTQWIIFGGKAPQTGTQEVPYPVGFDPKTKPHNPDSVLVVSKSGCYFKGNDLIHQQTCSCDDDYEQSL